KFEIRPARLDQKLEGMNTDPTQSQKGTPMDMNPGDMEAAMRDALVKVAGPMLEEQTEMRAQLRAQRLLLTLLYADRFREDGAGFDQLMSTILRVVPQALDGLQGGPHSPEALAAQSRVTRLLHQFQVLVSNNIAAHASQAR
uniref:hypothetical protein n=1 Tax=Curvibacter lanceolatus TaxID=86182 RepID=UPI001B7FA4AA